MNFLSQLLESADKERLLLHCNALVATKDQASMRSCTQHSLRPRVMCNSRKAIVTAAITVKYGNTSINVTKAEFSIGKDSSCDLNLPNKPNTSEQHAVLIQKGRQVFVKALVGDSMMDPSYTWLDGQPLRPRVAYVLGSGCKLTFGEEASEAYEVTFDQASGSNPLMEMMVKGMASKASPEVREQLDKLT